MAKKSVLDLGPGDTKTWPIQYINNEDWIIFCTKYGERIARIMKIAPMRELPAGANPFPEIEELEKHTKMLKERKEVPFKYTKTVKVDKVPPVKLTKQEKALKAAGYEQDLLF